MLHGHITAEGGSPDPRAPGRAVGFCDSCWAALQELTAGEMGTCQKWFGKIQSCLRATRGLTTPRCPAQPHLAMEQSHKGQILLKDVASLFPVKSIRSPCLRTERPQGHSGDLSHRLMIGTPPTQLLGKHSPKSCCQPPARGAGNRWCLRGVSQTNLTHFIPNSEWQLPSSLV